MQLKVCNELIKEGLQYNLMLLYIYIYSVFNIKVDSQLNREYFTSDAIYNGSAGMKL